MILVIRPSDFTNDSAGDSLYDSIREEMGLHDGYHGDIEVTITDAKVCD